MNELFERILDTRSLTVIDMLVEEFIEASTNEVDRALAKAILHENRLDEIYALCHERIALFHTQKAKELREFLARKYMPQIGSSTSSSFERESTIREMREEGWP